MIRIKRTDSKIKHKELKFPLYLNTFCILIVEIFDNTKVAKPWIVSFYLVKKRYWSSDAKRLALSTDNMLPQGTVTIGTSLTSHIFHTTLASNKPVTRNERRDNAEPFQNSQTNNHWRGFFLPIIVWSFNFLHGSTDLYLLCPGHTRGVKPRAPTEFLAAAGWWCSPTLEYQRNCKIRHATQTGQVAGQ